MTPLKSKAPDFTLLKKEDSSYPPLLREIPNPPAKLYVRGDLGTEEVSRLAIVGTRKATTAGRALAKKLARELSNRGFIIVSGLAMGIDAAAHEGAVAEKAITVAVLGNGIDSIYPAQNENLGRQILETGGAILSEYPPGTPSFPNQFLERNRIVSGLCLGVIVIEAPIDSGALVTARLAGEQGREVFVFPGPADHPNYEGSHKLIRDGARLVASVEDIMEDLNFLNPKSVFAKQIPGGSIRNPKQIQNQKLQKIKDEAQLKVFQIIEGAGEPVRIDKIIELTKLEPSIVSRAIAFLTIERIIKETEKGYTI